MLTRRRLAKAYDALRSGDVDEFLFVLALRLGRTVRELSHEMSHMEYVHWRAHFDRVAQQRDIAMKMRS